MFARGWRTRTPRGTSLTATLDAAGAPAGSPPNASSPKLSSKFNSGCDTIALLNLSLLESPVDSADGFIRRRLNDFDAAQILGAARDFERISGLKAVVGADGYF